MTSEDDFQAMLREHSRIMHSLLREAKGRLTAIDASNEPVFSRDAIELSELVDDFQALPGVKFGAVAQSIQNIAEAIAEAEDDFGDIEPRRREHFAARIANIERALRVVEHETWGARQ